MITIRQPMAGDIELLCRDGWVFDVQIIIKADNRKRDECIGKCFDLSQFDEYREDNRREVKKARGGLPISLWDTINNSKKVNINLLSEDDVQTYEIGDSKDVIMVIYVPPMAKREQKPV